MAALRRFIVVAVHAHNTVMLRSVLAETPVDAEQQYAARYGQPAGLDLYSEREWFGIHDRLINQGADVLPPKEK